MSTLLEGKTLNPAYQAAGTPKEISLSELGGVMNSPLDPALYAMARAGKIFFATHTVATAVAPLQVVPTTTAAFVVNNVDTSTSGKLVVPIMAGVFLGSGTAGIGTTLFAQVGSTALATQLAADTSGVTRGNTRGGLDASIAFVGLSKTVAGSWLPIASVDNAAAAVPGTGIQVPLHGMFVVRPTFAFGLHAVAGAGTSAAFVFSAAWLEIQGTTP